jgi:hypothetical protein
MVKKRIALTENIFTVTMATNLSIVIDKSHYENMLIIMPATWTAADITFVVLGTKTGTFKKLTYAVSGNEVTVKAVAGVVIALDGIAKEAIEACPFVKIRSGTAETPVTQDSPRTFTIVLSG